MAFSEGWFTDEDLESKGGGSQEFPAGHWTGTIDAVRIDHVTAGSNRDFLLNFYIDGTAQEAEIASIQLGSAEALAEGQPDPGQRKCFDEKIYLSIDGIRWDAPALNGDNNWRLLATRKRLTKLARALGVAETAGGKWRPAENFHDMLETDEIAGQKVAFEVYHKGWKSKDYQEDPQTKVVISGKKGINVFVAGYTEAI